MIDVKFYMLVEGKDNLYLALYDTEKNLISSYSNLNQSKINNYIENLKNEEEFFISWEKEKKSEYLKLDKNRHFIEKKMLSYLKIYKKALQKPNTNKNQNILSKSTLQYFHKELSILFNENNID